MCPKLNPLRITALTTATLIAAYLSYGYWGGVIVFANRIKHPTEFLLVWVPPMAFPAALVAWWKSRLGAILFALVILIFLGAVVVINWPHVGGAAIMMLRQLWPFLISGVLLALVALFDRNKAIRKNQ